MLRALIASLVVTLCVAGSPGRAEGSYPYFGIRYYGPRYYPYYGPYWAGYYYPWYATPYRFGYGVYHHAYRPYPWYYRYYAGPYPDAFAVYDAVSAHRAPGLSLGLYFSDKYAGCYYW